MTVQGFITTSPLVLRNYSADRQVFVTCKNPNAEQTDSVNRLQDTYKKHHLSTQIIYLQPSYCDRALRHPALSWDEVVQDGKHGWNSIRKNHEKGLDALESSMWMYKITGDSQYLDYAIDIADDLDLSYNRRQTIISLSKLAEYEPRFIATIENIADKMMRYELNHDTNLFYSIDGTREMYLPYGGADAIEALLKAYELTSNDEYVEQARKTIYSLWQLRDHDTNIAPGWLYSDNATVKAPFVQQYGMAAFTKILLHYYYLTGDHLIFSILYDYVQAASRYVWDTHRWNYRTGMNGTPFNGIIEANFPKLDDALLLTYDTDRTLFREIYAKSKQDYDSTFQNNFALTNGLIKHGVYDDGRDFPNHQSVIAHAFPVIQNLAMRFFSDTGDESYLEQVRDYYHSIVEFHKRADGYVSAVDPYSLADDVYNPNIDSRAAAFIANKILLTIDPSRNVTITWTRIGDFSIPEPFIAMFSDAGWFNEVKFDFRNRTITLHSVSGEGTIRFSNDIASATLDGKEYLSFKGNELQTTEGTHAYKVRLDSVSK